MAGAIVFEPAIQEDLEIGTGEIDVTNPGGGTIRGTRVNLGSFAVFRIKQNWSPGSLAVAAAAGSTVSVDIAAPGVVEGDFVLVTFDGSMTGDIQVFGQIVVDGVVRVTIINHGSTPANPGTGYLRVLVFKTNL